MTGLFLVFFQNLSERIEQRFGYNSFSVARIMVFAGLLSLLLCTYIQFIANDPTLLVPGPLLYLVVNFYFLNKVNLAEKVWRSTGENKIARYFEMMFLLGGVFIFLKILNLPELQTRVYTDEGKYVFEALKNDTLQYFFKVGFLGNLVFLLLVFIFASCTPKPTKKQLEQKDEE